MTWFLVRNPKTHLYLYMIGVDGEFKHGWTPDPCGAYRFPSRGDADDLCRSLNVADYAVEEM